MTGPTTPELYAIRLTRAQLRSLPEAYRELLIRMGLAMNDLLLLQRLYLAMATTRENLSRAASDARAAHILNLLLLLSGKVFEATEVYRRFFTARASHRESRARLSRKAQAACDTINRVTGESGLLATLRNSFAFHYHHAENLTQYLDSLENDDSLTLYLGKPDGNTLHFYALQPIWHSLIAATKETDGGRALDAVWRDVFDAIKALTTFTNGVAEVALTDMFGDDIRPEKCELLARDYKALDSVEFPPLMAVPTGTSASTGGAARNLTS